MKRIAALILPVVLAAALAGYGHAQETLLREDGTLRDAGVNLDSGEPVVWYPVSVDERSRVQVHAASVDFEPHLLLDLDGRRVRDEGTDFTVSGAVSGAVFLQPGEELRVGISKDPDTPARPPLAYSLRVEAGPAPDLLQPGETRGGDITNTDERLPDGRPVDWYPLRLEVGERVRLELQSVEFDAFLIVRTPEGGRLENDDVETTDAGLVYTAVEDGIAQVGATAFGPSERGAYLLAVERLDPPRELELGSTVSGTLGTNGSYTDDYLLFGKSGQMVLVELESPDFDTVLRLRAAGGYFAENDDADAATTDSELFYAFPEDGVLAIQAAGFSPEERGSYQLSVLRFQTEQEYQPHREGRRLSPGSEVSAILTSSAPAEEGRYYHRYTVTAEAGRLVRLGLSSMLFDGIVEVTSPTNETFTDDDSGRGSDAFVEFEAPESGIYRVRVSTFSPGNLGPYTLSYEQTEPPEVVAEFEGSLGPDSPTDEAGRPVGRHEYRAQAGETAIIEASSEDFDTMLLVRGTEGAVIAENDDFGSGWNSRVEMEFPRTGTYTLVVTSFWDDQNGDYTLTVSR